MRKTLWLAAIAAVGIAVVVGAVVLRVRQVAGRAATAPSDRATNAAPAYRLEPAEVAYDQKLGKDWTDWGWGPHELSSNGPAKVVFAGFGGIVLGHPELRTAFGGVSFRFRAPTGWAAFLAVGLRHVGSPEDSLPVFDVGARNTTSLADGWQQVFVPWNELNPKNIAVDRLAITARAAVGSEWVLLDKIFLTQQVAGTVPDAPSRAVDLKLACTDGTRPINPLIYGVANGDWESGQTIERIGGNLTSRLNWDADFWNTGNDWFFENFKVDGSIWDWLAKDASRGTPAAVTVPTIGWVAKDSTSVGFPKSKFPGQRKFDTGRPEAGDGFRPDGAKITPGSPELTSLAAPPQLIGGWVRRLREKDAARGARSALMYILDNEPSLWSSTHRDVHPEPLTYDELLDRTVRYATAIREADPDGLIAGPAEWGWLGYFGSGKDQSVAPALRPDRRAHGDVPLIPWYLAKLAEHERLNHVRLLDVLDVHFYPAAEGLYGNNPRVDPEGAALRIRATRSLWDPLYRDESWINESIALIPRLKKWVAENYPGLRISIGEWSFGAEDHISGGIATVEALGRFGQQGLDSAFYWNGPKKGTASFWAFRAFRNFDGKGARFLDQSLPARDAENVSLFASRDPSGNHLVAILVNRDASFAVNADIHFSSCGRLATRRIFRYGPGSTELSEVRPPQDPRPNTPIALPPYSFAVVDLQFDPR
jgi:Glycoside hydrolase family 44